MSIATRPSMKEIREHFEAILPGIAGRVRSYGRRFTKAEREEATAEMMALAWSGYVSKARRTGIFLSPGPATFMAYLRVRTGRVLATGGGVTDVHAPLAFRLGRVRVVYLSQLNATRSCHALDDSTVRHITTALSSSWHERVDHLAAVRLDWAALARTLDRRMRTILKGLAIGEKKGALARRIGVSAGRLSQLLGELAQEIRNFFGVENLPACCAA